VLVAYNSNKHETPGNYNNTTLLLANAVNPLECHFICFTLAVI